MALPKIVVLDDVSFTDQQLGKLELLGDVMQHSGLPANREEILNRLDGADICILGWTQVDAEIFSALPKLKLISIWATGVNYVDLKAATKRGIVVTNVPAYAANAVAELCVAFMIILGRRVLCADRHVREGHYRWQEFRGTELAGKTLGIIGLGSIGARLARLGTAFEMRVVGHTAHPSPERAEQLGVELREFGEVLEASDFLSLNCALVEKTRHLIDEQALKVIRPTTFLINTARFHVMDPDAVVAALQSGSLAGVALDDLDMASPATARLRVLDNVVLSPHAGFNTHEALWTKTNICIDNVAAYLAGRARNVVNSG